MSCGPAPTCGSQGVTTGSSLSSVPSDISWLFGILGTIGTIAGVVGKTHLVTIIGITAPAAVWLSAAAGALITFAVVFDFYRLRCLSNPDTLAACSAGVIERLVPAFNSATDELFPFTAMHDRADVVIKCMYWPLAVAGAGFVQCNSDALMSAILRGYYKSDKVCDAGLGATIGGAAGVVGGIIAGAVVGALVGCATVILCIFACLIALIIAAVAVLVGALIGGQIGKAAAGDSTPTSSDGSALAQGDYVTTQGGLLTSGDDQGARVYWFVQTTTLHGVSAQSSPFSHTDPDTNLVPDACPSVVR
jgi:hypothetical protein